MTKFNSRSARAARRVRSAQGLAQLLRDALQEAEAELYIDGSIRHVDEAAALTKTGTALNDLDESITSLMQLLGDLRSREEAPVVASEFDDLASVAREEGIFRNRA